MILTLTIPDDLTAPLRSVHGPDLERAALEELAEKGYSAGGLSLYQVQRMLGFTNRYDTESWLGGRGVNSNYDLEALEADRKTLELLFPR